MAAALAAAISLLLLEAGRAQPPLYTLPKDNFRWDWGETNFEERRGTADIEMTGYESFFRCELSVRFRPGTSLTPTDVRAIETSLRGRLDFIYGASETLNQLDRVRELDWATLDCKKSEGAPIDAAKSAEREAEAREKMQRELERRRARAQDKAE
jgi:hypothetical protein